MTVVPFPAKPKNPVDQEKLARMIEQFKARQAHADRITGEDARQNHADLIQHLKAAREAQGFTPADVGKWLGLPEGYVLSLEAGERHPTLMLLCIIADHLGYRLNLEPLP